MFILLVIVYSLLLEIESLEFYVNNAYKGSVSDGTERFPFKSFSEAFASTKIQNQNNETKFFTILSNNAGYEFNEKILFIEHIVISYKSSGNEKASLLVSSNSSFFVLCNFIYEKKNSLNIPF